MYTPSVDTQFLASYQLTDSEKPPRSNASSLPTHTDMTTLSIFVSALISMSVSGFSTYPNTLLLCYTLYTFGNREMVNNYKAAKILLAAKTLKKMPTELHS